MNTTPDFTFPNHFLVPVPVAARSKAWICGRSPAEIVGSNPTGGMDVFCCECCVLSARGLCDELITRPEESYRLWWVVVCNLETSRMGKPWPALGRSATAKKKSLSCTSQYWIRRKFLTKYCIHESFYCQITTSMNHSCTEFFNLVRISVVKVNIIRIFFNCKDFSLIHLPRQKQDKI